MKKRIVVANWKMNPSSREEAVSLFKSIKKKTTALRRVQTGIAPPYVFLPELARQYRGKKIAFGAQDVSFEDSGSYTGEVSAAMLKNVGASFVIVGHSERRALGEGNELIHKKLLSALSEGLSVILCIGETERDHGAEYLSFLKEELVTALRGIDRKYLKRIVVAYEPLWAIGKHAEDAMEPSDVHEMVIYIRKIISERFGKKEALKIPILYGGSVESTNAGSLLRDGEISGFLVGHASLDPDDFGVILKIASTS